MLEILKNRRSIRKYKDKKIEDEKIEQLYMQLYFHQPQEIFIHGIYSGDNKEKRVIERRSRLAFLKDAPFFVVLGDPQISDVGWKMLPASIIIQLTAQSQVWSCVDTNRKRP